MMEWLRKAARSPVAAFLFSILGVSFVIWGVSASSLLQAGRQSIYTITVGGRPITDGEIDRAIDQQIAAAEQQTGRKLTREEAKSQGLASNAVATLIESTALDADFARRGIVGSKTDMLRQINEAPAFKDPVSGKFSVAKYQEFVERQFKLQPPAFEKLFRADLARVAGLGALQAGINVPAVALDPLLAYAGETRDFQIFILPAALAADPGKPDETALKTFYKENPQFFERPERRSFVFISFHAKDFMGAASISEQELRDAFEKRKSRLAGPRHVTFDQLYFPDEASASEALRALTLAPDALAYAKAHALAAPARVKDVGPADLKDALFSQSLFAGKPGAVVGPFKAQNNQWIVAQIIGFAEPPAPSFEGARKDLEAELRAEHARADLEEAVDNFENASADGLDAETAGAKYGALVQRFVPLDAQARDADGAFYAYFRDEEAAFRKAFELAPGATSALVKLHDEGAGFVKLLKIEPKGTETLEKTRDLAVRLWQVRKRAEAMHARADALAKDLEGQAKASVASLAVIAKKHSALLPPPALNAPRGASNPNLPPQLLPDIFAATPGATVTEIAGQDGSVMVALLQRVNAPDPAVRPPFYDQAVSSLSERYFADAFEKLRNQLRARYKQVTNQKRLDGFTKAAADRTAEDPKS